METVLHLISQYGQIAVFCLLVLGIVGLPVPDETLLTFSGYLVYKGHFHYLPTVLVAFAGSVCGITISYLIGRTGGIYLVHKYGRYVHLTSERLDSVHRWFERMGRVFPKLHIDIEQVEVTGWPWNTTVFVKWRANASLLDGQSSYVNRGVHVFKLRWGKVYSIEEYFDSQAAERSLAIQARAGLDEAAAGPIVS